jgi:hypothetical protein
MPQRFLRPGLRTSERFNSVSRDAQILYISILTVVDDYGRYDGRPSVLHGDAFSVWNEKNPDHAVNPQRTAALCSELKTSGLVWFYEVNGKKCLQMLQWEERIREGSKERWPKPNESEIPQEFAALCRVPLPPPPSPPPSPPPKTNGADKPPVRVQFLKPSLEEVKLCAAKKGLPVTEAEKFFNYYESNGWRVGKNPMKSWPHAVANWAKNVEAAHVNGTNGNVSAIQNQTALNRVEDRQKVLRGQFPLTDQRLKTEWNELKTERTRLMGLLGFKA